jgi:hypothetical protein
VDEKKNMILKSSYSYNPWIYFFLFLAIDSYLSYVPSGDFEKYLVFLAGIFVPILMVLFSKAYSDKNAENVFKKEQFDKSATGLWVLLGLLFMGLRFWKLTTLFRWPTGDEASIGMLAIGLIRQWNWHFFHGFAQLPFFFYWLCAVFYRVTNSPALSLWFLSAVVSMALIPLTYLGSRRFCGKSFSFILMGLMATGFWPMYLGRYGFIIFLFLGELIVFYLLLIFMEQTKEKSSLVTAGVLGFVTGLGLYTWTSWIVIGVAISLVVGWVSFKSKKNLPMVVFLILMMIPLSFFLVAVLREGYGQHLQAVGFWNGEFSWKDQINRFFDYWMILWGTVDQGVVYASPCGGFLNPILAALFFLGIIEIFLRFSKVRLFLFLLLLTLFLSPGFLSWSLETYRVLAVLPLLLLAVALGLKTLLEHFSPNYVVLIAILVLSSSFALDFYRLTLPYSHPDDQPGLFETTGRSYEKYYVGRILEGCQKLYGPGLIYSDFVPSTTDESLAFMTYPYNCAWNPDLVGEKPRWAALFINSHYQPFLAKRFPEARWQVIPTADPKDYGSHVLGIVPITFETLRVFRSWQSTYDFCMGINLQLLDKANGKSSEDILEEMIEFYNRVPDDLFLQSIYFEKFMDFYERQRFFYKGETSCNYYSYSKFLDSSLKKGYPDTVVYAFTGRLLMQEGQFKKARMVFKKALKFDPGNRLAVSLLSVLKTNASTVPEK